MAQLYANIIIDISHEKVDKIFQYRIPESMEGDLTVGMQVLIPFGAGNSQRKGYVVGITPLADYDREKIKEVAGIVTKSISAQSQLIQLAWWMKEQYGSTMNQALKTVLPVKQKMKVKEKKTIHALWTKTQLREAAQVAGTKHFKARERLLLALAENPVIPYEVAVNQMNLSSSTWKPLEEKGVIRLESSAVYRNPASLTGVMEDRLKLNDSQQSIVEGICSDYDSGIRKTYLIHGITGSGKTEVYMELISHVLESGRQVIVLIPEIALTYQTVMRFYKRFGDRICIINSRLSQGERFDQFERARKGEADIMIGPRSALFTPFPSLGLVIIDEEHEGAYKSETSPRYHAREVAVKRAAMNQASVVLGSATPSMEAYTKALQGEYGLYQLKVRAKEESRLAAVRVIDLREELKSGNKSIFSKDLQEKISLRLEKKEQVILFINRRGYSNFVSCRSCGEAIKCPHCDVTLTLHNNSRLVCHYCGHQINMPERCPSCQSPYIAAFGTGTQKIEWMAKKMFPAARILRMDLDTTSKKDGHGEILSAFGSGEADILIGTQMIVKGHDFPNVTLVGVLAADLSLYTPDFRCSERTFQLLTQAAGRAGRAGKEGEVVIQTYSPDHYSIVSAANQDYPAFYEQEMAFREMLNYPPVCTLLTIQFSSRFEEKLDGCLSLLYGRLEPMCESLDVQLIGPAQASIYKINDIYRKILYIKQKNYDILIQIKNETEVWMEHSQWKADVLVQYDFS